MSNQVQLASQQARELREFLSAKSVIAELMKVLPATLSPERMVRQTLTLAQKNYGLIECSPVSILGGLIQAAELGLEMSGHLGHAYLVPRWNKQKKCKEATFQIGYRGLLELAFRSGKVTSFPLRVVYPGDEFSIVYGTSQRIHHIPKENQEGSTPRGYYAVAHFGMGVTDFDYMSHTDIVKHRTKYGASESGPWTTDFDAMAPQDGRAPPVQETPSCRGGAEGRGDGRVPRSGNPRRDRPLTQQQDGTAR